MGLGPALVCPWAARTNPLEMTKLFSQRSGVPNKLWQGGGGILLPPFSFWQHHPKVLLLPVRPYVYSASYRDPRNLRVLGFRAWLKSRMVLPRDP